MGGWVHTEERWGVFGVCYEPVQTGETPTPCGCRTPEPDPASPCGYVGCRVDSGHAYDEWCWHDPGPDCHPHQPTRCTCGHPIKKEEKP